MKLFGTVMIMFVAVSASKSDLPENIRQIIECGIASGLTVIPSICYRFKEKWWYTFNYWIFSDGISLSRKVRFAAQFRNFIKGPRTDFCAAQVCQRSQLLLDIRVRCPV